MSEYYRAYEERYRAVEAAGGGTWGHSAEERETNAALESWVRENALAGKRVAEFACGEGAGGVILSRLGCVYSGFDIAPTAVEKARRALAEFPGARVRQLDMVRQRLDENSCDGALDMSGLHMLVTDVHRSAYLKNVVWALKPGAPALFWQEAYREDAYEAPVMSIEEWERISGLDFHTPEKRAIGDTGREVMLRLLPARPRTKEGYAREFQAAGFEVLDVRELKSSDFMAFSAAIWARKPE